MDDVIRLAKGGGINLLGAILGQALNCFFLIVLTRFLGPDQAGIFVLGMIVVIGFGTLTLLGLNRGLVRYLAIYARSNNKASIRGTMRMSWQLVSGMSLLITLGLILGSNWLANHVFNEPKLASVLEVMALSIPFQALMILFDSSSQAFKIMRYTVLVEKLWRPMAQLGLTGLALWLGFQLRGVTIAYVVAVASASVLAFSFMLKVIPLSQPGPTPVEKGALLRFSMPLLLTNVVTYTMIQAETLLLGLFVTSADVGIYYAAWRIAVTSSILMVALNSIFAPFVSDLYYHREIAELEDLFKMATRWGFAFGLPILSIFIIFARPIMSIFGSGFVAGGEVLMIVAFGQIVNMGVGLAGVIITMSGRSALNLFNMLSLLALKVVLGLILIRRYGLLGAAISGTLASVLINVAELMQIFILIRIHPYNRSFLKPCLASGLASVIVIATRQLLPEAENLIFLLGHAVLFIIVYFITIWTLGFEPEDIRIKQALWQRPTIISKKTAGL